MENSLGWVIGLFFLSPPRPLSHRNERGGVRGRGAIPPPVSPDKRDRLFALDSPSFIPMREGAGGVREKITQPV